MVKISKNKHIRKKGVGKGKPRKNPKMKRGKFGKKKKFPQITGTMFLQDPQSGKMLGRTHVKGKGDDTGIYRESAAGRIVGRVGHKGKKRYSPKLNKIRFVRKSKNKKKK